MKTKKYAVHVGDNQHGVPNKVASYVSDADMGT